jgi:Kef-type K+ transport system membrane component KefB
MDLALILLQVGVMLAVAIVFGQAMRLIGQPVVLGELVGGIVLGPTVFGFLAPDTYSLLFPPKGMLAVSREAFINIGMLFFLFTSGLEVSSEQLKRSGLKVMLTCLLGMLVPFALGYGSVWLFPGLWNHGVHTGLLPLSLFVGLALSITALPVIARILVDLGLIKEDLGTVIMSAATINDLIGWTLFAILLGIYVPQRGLSPGIPWNNLVLMMLFVGVVLAGGRWFGPSGFHWIHQRLPWPSAFIGVTSILILVASAATDLIGMHTLFGAFFMGVALNQEFKERALAREVIHQFAISFFAPLYFVSLGLKVNFVKDFDLLLVMLVLVIACAGKFFGAGLGAWLGGLTRRESLIVGAGMSARGVMELVLATIALENGLIDNRIFVALFIMAVVTSMASGPLMKWLIRTGMARQFGL